MMEEYIIGEKSTILDALARLNLLTDKAHQTLFVVDNSQKLSGTLTDGDVRRGVLRGLALNASIEECSNKKFRAIMPSQTTLDIIYFLKECRAKGITLVPQLNEEGRIIRILDLTQTPTILPLSAVLMAGGKGERLRPYTLTTPKPLLQIENKAIIDYNIDRLIRNGIKDITVCTGYLAEQIEEHFKNPYGETDITVECVRETTPLGTIGAVSLTNLYNKEDGDTLVMNSDIITSLSFEDMYLHHIKTDSDITMGVINYSINVPFAVVETSDDNVIEALSEKPSFSYLINSGIYIFKNRIFKKIRRGEKTDAPDLIMDAIESGSKVTAFAINGTWIDVGSTSDFGRAKEIMKHLKNLDTKL